MLFIIDKYCRNNQYDNNNKTKAGRGAGGLRSLSSVIIGCQHTPSQPSRTRERRGEEAVNLYFIFQTPGRPDNDRKEFRIKIISLLIFKRIIAKSGFIFSVFLMKASCPDYNNRFFDCFIHTFFKSRRFLEYFNEFAILPGMIGGTRPSAQPICYFR